MLYSCAVYFYTKEDIFFPSYEAEALHGLLFNIISQVDFKYAHEVHEDYTKFFTLSNLLPFTKRVGKNKLLEKNKNYKFRVTFLNDKLFEYFCIYFLHEKNSLLLNGVPIIPTKILTTDLNDTWCGEAEFDDLLMRKAGEQVSFKFLTTTSFRREERNFILPTPDLVFGGLLSKWQKAGGPELSLTSEDFGSIEINRYDLKTRLEKFSNYSVKGFTGECEYWFGNKGSQKKKELMALAQFAFYAGVGYKTTMGLGQVRVNNNRQL